MRITDLGELKGEVLLFGGPVSNLHATEALIEAARARGIPPARMVCTGDVAAYCAHPRETLARIMVLGCPVVQGNCEQQLAGGAEDCGCGFADGSECSVLSGAWYAHAAARVTDAQRVWMAARPERIVFSHAGRRVAVIHGGARSVNAFLWQVTPESVLGAEIAALRTQVGPVDMVVAGHSGIAFHRRAGGVEWVNAGAIGMPPNRGEPSTEYARLDADGAVSLHRLEYDAAAARAAMEAAGLVQGYHAALTDGWWPSQETLPERMRQRG